MVQAGILPACLLVRRVRLIDRICLSGNQNFQFLEADIRHMLKSRPSNLI